MVAAGTDGTDEVAVLVVIEDRSPVRAGHYHHAAIFSRGVVEGNAHGAQIVVGVRIVGKVLVPLDWAAAVGWLHVELVALGADGRADQGRQQV